MPPKKRAPKKALSTAPDAAEPAAPAAKRSERVWTPSAADKSKATQLRIIALVLWVVAIGLEAFAIFWVMKPSTDEMIAAHGFPQWRWWLLIGLIVVIAVLAIVGSQLWKRANDRDPASRQDKVRFFVQNQLGAIIALIAFIPLIIMVYLNKDMDSKQKNIAGAVGIVAALAAVLLGADFSPMSQEQKFVESQVVTKLTGQDLAYWTEGGSVVHLCEGVSDLANSSNIQSGPVADALSAGKEGITLKLDQELTQCNLPVPDDLDDIVAWVRQARGLDAAA